jgi:hypothetical protein
MDLGGLALLEVFFESAKITLIVVLLMAFIELIHIRHEKKIDSFLSKSQKNQIFGSSMLGAFPGCIGTFFVVSLYSHGIVRFGALAAAMIATFGDEAFFVLAMVPQAAVPLFASCLIFGIIGGFLAQKILGRLSLEAPKCRIEVHKNEEKRGALGKHFWKEHIWEHIIKKHAIRLFLWLYFSLLAIRLMVGILPLESVLPQNAVLLIFAAAIIGLIPQSGPHLIFITLFSQGLVPFSVLLVSSISQEGHGLLPLLSFSVRDAVLVKAFKFVFALAVGLVLFCLGV